MFDKLKKLFRKEQEEESENIKHMKELYEQNNNLLLYLMEKNMEVLRNDKTGV